MRRSPDPITLVLALAALALHAAAMAAALGGAIPLPLAFAACALAAYVAFTPAHEAAHGNAGGGGAVDELVGTLCAALLFAPFASLRALHLRHHRHVNDPAHDPDRWVAGGNAVSIALRCLTILPRYYAAFLRVPPGEARPPLARTLGTQVVFGALLAIAAARGRLALVLLLWPGAALLAAGALAFFFDWLPHRPHESGARYHEARVVLVPGLALVTLGHAYHLVHHLWPQVPFHEYARVFRARRGELARAGARIDDYSGRFGTSTVERSLATNTSGWIAEASTRNGSSEP